MGSLTQRLNINPLNASVGLIERSQLICTGFDMRTILAIIELSVGDLVKGGVRNILQTYQKQEFLVNLTFVSAFLRSRGQLIGLCYRGLLRKRDFLKKLLNMGS